MFLERPLQLSIITDGCVCVNIPVNTEGTNKTWNQLSSLYGQCSSVFHFLGIFAWLACRTGGLLRGGMRSMTPSAELALLFPARVSRSAFNTAKPVLQARACLRLSADCRATRWLTRWWDRILYLYRRRSNSNLGLVLSRKTMLSFFHLISLDSALYWLFKLLINAVFCFTVPHSSQLYKWTVDNFLEKYIWVSLAIRGEHSSQGNSTVSHFSQYGNQAKF